MGNESAGNELEEELVRRNGPLFWAAVISGNWDKSEEFIKENRDMVVKARSSSSGKNALHEAISAGHVHIVEKLVDWMTETEL